MSEDKTIDMLGSVVFLLEHLSNQNQDQTYLLEQMAKHQGIMGSEHEKKVIEELQKRKKLYKQDVKAILSPISNQGTLDVMERLAYKRSEVAFISGHGQKSSCLIYGDPKTMEYDVIKLVKLMPKGTGRNKFEVLKELGLEEDELPVFVRTVKLLLPSEFNFDGDFIRRCK